jgi:hypothetical protein
MAPPERCGVCPAYASSAPGLAAKREAQPLFSGFDLFAGGANFYTVSPPLKTLMRIEIFRRLRITRTGDIRDQQYAVEMVSSYPFVSGQISW